MALKNSLKSPKMQVMSKSDFAAHIGVSPGRLSQYLSAGIVDTAALDGEGRNAKIKVDVAVEQIRMRRHVGQSLGNGIGTRLDLGGDGEVATADPRPVVPLPPRENDIAYQIQQERLASERRKNRIAGVEELASQGRLVSADQARNAMAKVAREIDEENAAMLADFASAIAAEFSLPQRDVLHLLRKVRTERKAVAAERLKARAQAMGETIEVTMEVSTV